jgi:multidrug efflux pump subunit AcrA (membrane-fusion protein)
VDQPRLERRQPPPPEAVVMPPIAADPVTRARAPRRRSPWLLAAVLVGALAAGAVWLLQPSGELPSAPTPTVRVVTPQPTTFYRWFDALGVVVAGQDRVLGFTLGGRLQDALAPGTTFSGGETVARLQGAKEREATVNQIRGRLGHYEQMLDTSRAQGQQDAVRLAEQNIAARKRALADSQAALAQLEIRPPAAGEIAEVMVTAGAPVRPGAPVVRLRATGPRAEIPLSPDESARARTLGFCRVETVPGTGGVDGGVPESRSRALDCTLPPGGSGGDGKAALTVDLAGTSIPPGTQVRLASGRWDGVFPVPRTAVAHGSSGDHLWVATPAGTANRRPVAVAAAVGDLVLVSGGLRAGEAVIVDPPAVLHDGMPVERSR